MGQFSPACLGQYQLAFNPLAWVCRWLALSRVWLVVRCSCGRPLGRVVGCGWRGFGDSVV